jgi:DnaJ-class molecular chaperone
MIVNAFTDTGPGKITKHTCHHCKGSGHAWSAMRRTKHHVKCEQCKGVGFVIVKELSTPRRQRWS